MNKNNLLFTEKDIELLDNNIEKIKEEVELIKDEMFKPPLNIKRQILSEVLKFVVGKKRKIYGGFAVNELIIMDGRGDPIYDEGSVNDIDFYTPDPINDVIDLCDHLHKLELGDVRCREAVHAETYSIFVDGELYCDISYVPKNIYNRMPFKTTKNNLILIHPHFMWIDYLRMLTDPINSWFRIEKSYRRFQLIQQYYKFPQNLSGIDVGGSTSDLDIALYTVLAFLKGNDTTTTVGFYAYNCFLDESKAIAGMSRNKKSNSRNTNNDTRTRTSDATLKYLDVPYYEFVSTNYKEDSLNLINKLKESFPDNADAITYTEYYPFFQLTGFNVSIRCNGDIVAKIYSNAKRCLPYQDVKCKYYNKTPSDHHDFGGKIRIGTFSLTLLFNLINIQRHRTDNEDEMKELFYVMTSHLLHMRNYYFDRTNKNILDKTIFREMETKCIGKTMTPFMEKALRIEKRKKENRRYTFNYDPSMTLSKRPRLMFANSSGNPINNPKNLKLEDHVDSDDVDDDGFDDNDDETTSKIDDQTDILNKNENENTIVTQTNVMEQSISA